MSQIDLDRLRRDHGFDRAAQLLADAVLCRRGHRPQPLKEIEPHEREWLKQTSRQVIEIFELVTTNKRPDAEQAAALAAAERQRAAVLEQVYQLRMRAVVAAQERGHALGTWRPLSDQDGHEAAHCRRCTRKAEIEVGREPEMAGPALSKGCLSGARDSRPDAFLANQGDL